MQPPFLFLDVERLGFWEGLKASLQRRSINVAGESESFDTLGAGGMNTASSASGGLLWRSKFDYTPVMESPLSKCERESLKTERPDFVPRSGMGNRWLAGTAAAVGSAAFAGKAEAKTVQITLNETRTFNDISALNNDVTGDGVDEFDFRVVRLNTNTASATSSQYRGIQIFDGSVFLAHAFAVRRIFPASSTSTKYFAVVQSSTSSGATPQFIQRFALVRFTSSRINGGQETVGYIYFRAYNDGFTDHTVEMVRLIFDDADPDGPGAISDAEVYPEWVDPILIQRAFLLSKIRKFKKKLRLAKRKDRKAKVRRLKKKIRKLKRQVAAL